MQKISFLFISFVISFSTNFAVAGTWQRQKMITQFGERDFLFYTPQKMEQRLEQLLQNEMTRRPLIIGLHGCLQSATDFAGLTGIEKIADENGVYVLLPEQDRFDNLNRCWNWHTENNQRRGKGEPAIIIEMVKWAQNKYQVDHSRIYIFGPSAGGSMTANTLATYPDYFAAGMVGSGVMFKAGTGLISGLMAAKLGSSNDPKEMLTKTYNKLKDKVVMPNVVPLMVFNGDEDDNCHPINSEQLIEQFVHFNDLLDDQSANQSIHMTPVAREELQVDKGYAYTHTSYGPSKDQVVVESYLVYGMGHGWSGGDDEFDYNYPLGPDETKLMWEFFSRHTKK